MNFHIVFLILLSPSVLDGNLSEQIEAPFSQILLSKDQTVINNIVMGFSPVKDSPVSFKNLPEEFGPWTYVGLKLGTGKHAMIYACLGKKSNGQQIVLFDTNHDRDMANEIHHTFREGKDMDRMVINLRHSLSRKAGTVQVTSRLEILRDKNGRMHWHLGTFGFGKVEIGPVTMPFGVLMLGYSQGILVLDSDQDGIFDQTVNAEELVTIAGINYKPSLDTVNQILVLKRTEESPVTVGFPAPILHTKLYGTEKNFDLSTQKSKATLLMFSSPHCSGCIKAMPEVITIHKNMVRNNRINFIYLAKNEEDVAYIQKRYHFAPDFIVDQKIWKDFHVVGMPVFIVVDRNGNIVYRESGWNDSRKSCLTTLLKKHSD